MASNGREAPHNAERARLEQQRQKDISPWSGLDAGTQAPARIEELA